MDRAIVERIRRAPIRYKLLLISAVYVIVVVGLLVLAHLALGFVSNVRAYVGGESLWSKSQKNAVYSLVKYTVLHREKDYQAFLDFMRVPLGDHEARVALSQVPPDYERAEAGFLAGRNHPGDVSGMAHLFVRFGWYPKLARAIKIWAEADDVLGRLRGLAQAIHGDGLAGRLNSALQTERLVQIDEINARLTRLEDQFSSSLGDAERQITHIVNVAGLSLTLLAILLGGLVSGRISRRIVSSISALRDGARRIGSGSFEGRIEVNSEDELGELASAFNAMNESLAAHIEALEGARSALAEMDRLKTEFFANVSHELRTPLTLILGPVARLLDNHDLPDRMRRDAAVIEQNAQLLLKHVNDLLDLSRLDAGRMALARTRVNLGELARRVAGYFEVLANERPLHFDCSTAAEVIADVDTDKVERLLFNLISNAFKFTPQGGTIQVAVDADQDEAQIVVEDSGPGVPEAMRQVIFERFRQGDGGSTRRKGGTGLGLAIAHEFVNQHRGRIEVNDSPLGGARFEVTLPLRAPQGEKVGNRAIGAEDSEARAITYLAELTSVAAPMESNERTGLASWDPERAHILVVEDNLEMLRFLVDGLSPDFQVDAAGNGIEALAAARRRRPDLILSDIMMPEMSGDQLLAELQRHDDLADIPFVVLSAKADDDLRLRMLQQGAKDFVIKPFLMSEVVARLGNLVASEAHRSDLERAATESKRRAVELDQDLIATNRELSAAVEHLRANKKALHEALVEKEILLQEVHHRVKNNLQIVASMIHLEEVAIDSPEMRGELRQCRDRVRTMALLHETLHQGTSRGLVDFASYVRRLTSSIMRWHSTVDRRVSAEVEVDELALDMDVAVPCGLILNELVSNSLEHAFPDGREGQISIRGRYDSSTGLLNLDVSDNGVGSSITDPRTNGDRLGLKLVDRLVRQVRGSMRRLEGEGMHWKLVVAAGSRGDSPQNGVGS